MRKQELVTRAFMGRRDFLRSSAAVGIGAFGASFATRTASFAQEGVPDSTIMRTAPAGGMKAWAEKNLRGGESFIMPSFTPDFKDFDEEGVRRDVRHAITQGFCSILPLGSGLSREDRRRFNEVVADEAAGKIYLVGTISGAGWSRVEQSVRNAERLGSSHALMYFNANAKSQQEIYEQMLEILEQTKMGVVLYAKPETSIQHLDPTGLPLEAFDRVADHDKVVAVKFTQSIRPATAYAVAESVGDRLHLGVVDLELMLPLSLKYPMQWTGQWAIDSLQSPETPWVSQFLELLRTGKNKEAYELYWQYEPIATAFYQLQAPSLSIGGHPWVHIKYMKWLTGGNGGLLADYDASSDYVPHLNQADREKCRDAFAKVGIETTDLPDESFIVGNAAYERGVRASDLSALPQYQT